MERQDELQIARTPQPADDQEPSNASSIRCIDGRIVRPRQQEEESPSTACDSSTVSISTQGGVRSGAAKPTLFRSTSRSSAGSIYPIAASTTKNIGEYIIDCRGLPATMDTLGANPRPCPEIRLQDPATRALGQEELIQTIQRATHPVEAKDQG